MSDDHQDSTEHILPGDLADAILAAATRDELTWDGVERLAHAVFEQNRLSDTDWDQLEAAILAQVTSSDEHELTVRLPTLRCARCDVETRGRRADGLYCFECCQIVRREAREASDRRRAEEERKREEAAQEARRNDQTVASESDDSAPRSMLRRLFRKRPSKQEILASFDQALGQPVLVEDNSDHGYDYPGRIVGPARYGPSGEIVHPVRMELTGDLFLVSHEAMYTPDRVDHRWKPLEPTTPLTTANSPLMMYFTGWYRYYESQGGTVRDRRW